MWLDFFYFANDNYFKIVTVMFLLFIYFRVTPGIFRPTSAADVWDEIVAYRDAAGQTVALPGQHREYTVANRSITGTDRDNCLSQTRSDP